MAPDPSGSFLQSGVFDKVEPWRRASKRRTTVDEQPQPQVRHGISTNCSPSRRTSPVVLLELMPRERTMPWTPMAAVAAPRSSARFRRTGPVGRRPSPYGEVSLRSLTQPTNDHYCEGFRLPAPARAIGSLRGRRPKASVGGNRGTEGLRLPHGSLWGFE